MVDEPELDEGALRVSDAERQLVVDRLSRAVGDGLITLDEFADSAGQAYASVTRDQLDSVARDLRLPVLVPIPEAPAVLPDPATGAAVEAPAPAKRRWIVAVMSGQKRRGKWKVGRRTGAFALMGGVDLDLRDAVLEGDVVEITAWAVMGGVDIVVPEGIAVDLDGFVLMGGSENRTKDLPIVPGSPVIRVKGYGMWGGVTVRSKPPRRDGEPEAPTTWERMQQGELPGLAAGGAHGHGRHRDRGEHGRDGAPPPSAFGRPPPPPPPVPPIRLPNLPGVGWTAPSPPVGGLVTIVSTDIVGSTRLADTLGDQRWRAVLAEHNALLRERIERFGGTEVKTSGDGFLLTFTSARAAVHFGVEVQEALARHRAAEPDVPLEVRIGVHAGEVERDGHDVVGRNVSLACRLCDAAAPNEVLVSAVVADLADSASDLTFGDLRTLRLAGIDRDVLARPATHR